MPITYEGSYEKLPKKLKQELEKHTKKYDKIHELYKKGKNIDKEIIDLYTGLLKTYLETKHLYFKNVLGDLPIVFETEKLRFNKNIEEIEHELVNMDAPNIDPEKLAKKKLQEFEELGQKFE
ncbi:MAG: hypothetical protein V1886_03080 [archaeon]